MPGRARHSPGQQNKLADRIAFGYQGMMNARKLSRRDALARAGLLVGTAVIADRPGAAAAPDPASQPTRPPFRYCLNTATIRGHKLGIVKEIEVRFAGARAAHQRICTLFSVEALARNTEHALLALASDTPGLSSSTAAK